MAFLRSVSAFESAPAMHAERVLLRFPASGDYLQWAELRARSRQFLTQWEPVWAPDELTRGAYRRRLRQYYKELREEVGYAYFIHRRADQRLIGGLSLSNVRRGVMQTATLGYWMGEPYAGQGYMTEAVAALIPFVFHQLMLHRLEAACIPSNMGSMRVLEKNGFGYEGLARGYLKINGRWQDHNLFALVNAHPGGGS